jgi:Helix-turn-helix domain
MSVDIDDLRETRRHVFRSSVDASTKLVALALLDHWSRTTETFPSIDRLAAWTSLNRTTVIRCLGTLEKLGGILVTRRNGASNRYALGQLSLLPVAPRDQSDDATGRTSRPEPVAPRDQSDDATSRTSRPEPVALRDSTSRATRPEVSQEVSHQESHSAARAPDPPTDGIQKRQRGRQRQHETALPPDWQPTDAHRAFAAQHQLHLELEVDSFRGWAAGKTTVSWEGTFTTRLANRAKWDLERRGGGRGAPVMQRSGTVVERGPPL